MSSRDELIRYLQKHSEPITVKNIAFDLGVTPRTIQNYLKSIRDEHKYQIETSQKGVFLAASGPSAGKEEVRIPQNYEERKMWILRKGLLNDYPMYMDHIGSYLGISYTTLQSELNRMRKDLAPYKLRIRIHGDEFSFAGSDYNKKAFVSKLIYDETGSELLSVAKLNDMFPAYNAESIKTIIANVLKEKKYYIDEFSLMNLVLHILISLNTHAHNSNITDNSIPLKNRATSENFVSVIDDIFKQITQLYPCDFTNDEKYQIYVLLTTRVTSDTIAQSEAKIEEVTDYRTVALLDKIVAHVGDIYQLDLNESRFRIGFAMHLYNMLIRADQQVRLHNPLLQTIKITSPFIYDIAIYISTLIHNETGLEVNDDEISYIALHVGARLEEVRETESKLKTVIVCPNYYSYVGRQVQNIPSMYSKEIYVSVIVSNPEELSNSGTADLIISTVPIERHHSDCVVITNFVSEADKTAIQDAILQAKKDKIREKDRGLLRRLFSKDLFKAGAVYKNQDEAMRSVCQRMYLAKYVGSDFLEKTKEREVISPTNYGRLAIPHPVNYYSVQTVIEVTTLSRPVQWASSMISIIFTIAISKKDYPEFQNIFGFLTSICMDHNAIDLLSAAKTYEEFMDRLMNLYEKQ
jgi:lichenan operon transcriptional antiterminator